MKYKQAMVVREDLDLPKGKLAVQVAHAAVESSNNADENLVEKWREDGGTKIVVKVDNLDELRRVKQHADDVGLATALIKDAGKTVVSPGTATCIGIGPDSDEKIDKVISNLSLLR